MEIGTWENQDKPSGSTIDGCYFQKLSTFREYFKWNFQKPEGLLRRSPRTKSTEWKWRRFYSLFSLVNEKRYFIASFAHQFLPICCYKAGDTKTSDLSGQKVSSSTLTMALHRNVSVRKWRSLKNKSQVSKFTQALLLCTPCWGTPRARTATAPREPCVSQQMEHKIPYCSKWNKSNVSWLTAYLEPELKKKELKLYSNSLFLKHDAWRPELCCLAGAAIALHSTH